MNLDVNINLTLSKTIEEGKVLIPLYGPGKTGLENLGNSCYLNVIVQILFSLENFKKWYFDNAIEHLNSCYKHPSECYLCQMSKIMYGLHSGFYSQKKTRQLPSTEEGKEGEIEEYQDGIKPSSFKLFFGKDHAEFSTNKQQDAFEYMNYLLEQLKKYDKVRNINPLKLFEFQIEVRLECNECNSVKYRKSIQNNLQLSVSNWKEKKDENSECTLDDCLQNFLAEEYVDLDCPICKKKTKWTKTQRILNYPKYLILNFERFVYDWVPLKLECKFNTKLDDFDLKILNREHSKPDEKIIESGLDELNEEEEKEPEFKEEDINFLLQCGIPELGAKWALYKNYNNPEIAIEWYCENSEKEEYKKPLPKIKVKSNKNEDNDNENLLYKDGVKNLMGMGFTKGKAISALKLKNGNIEDALDLLINDYDSIKVDDSYKNNKNFNYENQYNKYGIDESKLLNKNNGYLYDLYACIYHLGKDQKNCHYVCNIKDNNVWDYYDDLNVKVMENPPFEKASIYFFKNKTE